MNIILDTIGIIIGCVIGRMIYDNVIKNRHASKFTFKIERGKKDES